MAPPAQPYVVIQSGLTMGMIILNAPFSWYNSGGGSCTVSNVGNWCQNSSYGPIAGGASVQATPTVMGNFSYTSPCCQANNPVIHVNPIHPAPKKK